jgi:hypothetical protein
MVLFARSMILPAPDCWDLLRASKTYHPRMVFFTPASWDLLRASKNSYGCWFFQLPDCWDLRQRAKITAAVGSFCSGDGFSSLHGLGFARIEQNRSRRQGSELRSSYEKNCQREGQRTAGEDAGGSQFAADQACHSGGQATLPVRPRDERTERPPAQSRDS